MPDDRSPLVLATSVRGASGGLASAATLAAVAAEADQRGGAILVEVGAPERGRGPTLLASESARMLERRLADRVLDLEDAAGVRVAARGRLCWLSIAAREDDADSIGRLEQLRPWAAGLTVAYLPAPLWRVALDWEPPVARGGLIRAELPRDRALAALAASELRERELGAKIATRAPGRVAMRRACAGLDPGGPVAQRARRWLRGLLPSLAGERGQAVGSPS